MEIMHNAQISKNVSVAITIAVSYDSIILNDSNSEIYSHNKLMNSIEINFDKIKFSAIVNLIKKLSMLNMVHIFIYNFDMTIFPRWINKILEYNCILATSHNIDNKNLYTVLKEHCIDLYIDTDRNNIEHLSKLQIPCILVNKDHIYDNSCTSFNSDIKFAFDFDATLVDGEADRVYKKYGLIEFQNHEVKNKDNVLQKLPLMNLLKKIYILQCNISEFPITTYMVTARGNEVKHRCLNTLKYYDVKFTKRYFMSGKPKGPKLHELGIDLFFDDTLSHINSAFDNGVIAGLVL